MKSVRLGPGLEEKLARAARVSGKSESEIIREGVEGEANRILGNTVYDQIKDLIGSVHGRGLGSSTMTGAEIAEEMYRDAQRRRRKPRQRS